MAVLPKQRTLLLLFVSFCGYLTLEQEPYQYFEKNWCRQRTLRTDWRTYTHSCPSYTRHWAFDVWSDDFKTHPNLSYISGAEINPAGHFSKIYIQSVTVLNRTKTFGGDAWRMTVNGPADLVASVHDMENGTYQAMFLPMEPGTYSLKIVLDFTLCHGLKNPPPDWFSRGEVIWSHYFHVRLKKTIYRSFYVDFYHKPRSLTVVICLFWDRFKAANDSFKNFIQYLHPHGSILQLF